MSTSRRKIVIAFGHKRRRGKDTAAQIALEWIGSKHARIDHFAHSLKEGIGKGVFGLTDAQLYGDQKTTPDGFWGRTPRSILQYVGTEMFRWRYDSDIWAKTVLRRYLNDSRHVLIPDLRFPNEAQLLKGAMSAVLVCVDRDIESDGDQDQHDSETALDNFIGWDHVIDNNGTLDELRTRVLNIVVDEFKS